MFTVLYQVILWYICLCCITWCKHVHIRQSSNSESRGAILLSVCCIWVRSSSSLHTTGNSFYLIYGQSIIRLCVKQLYYRSRAISKGVFTQWLEMQVHSIIISMIFQADIIQSVDTEAATICMCTSFIWLIRLSRFRTKGNTLDTYICFRKMIYADIIIRDTVSWGYSCNFYDGREENHRIIILKPTNWHFSC